MIFENLTKIRNEIDLAVSRSGRKPSDVNLVGVSKTKSLDMIRDAFELGLIDIGENYVEEFSKKWSDYKPESLRYHFLGRLPTKKVRKIVGKVQLIHSVDSLKLAQKIDFVSSEEKVCQEILIQVNQGRELSKSGISQDSLELLFMKISSLKNIKIKGLMSIPPFSEPARPYFQELRRIRDSLEQSLGIDLPYLSMGMSGDFREAIEEGSTHIRVGTAIFGQR